MESSSFLATPTLLERAEAAGLSTALVTSKAKLCRLLSRGSGIAFSAQSPPKEMVEAVGPKEDIYSSAIDLWMLQAVRHVLKKRKPTLVFAATTDYIPHHHPPESPEAQAHFNALDAELGRIQEENPDRRLFITADHGMREKREAADLDRVLARQKIPSRTIPIIRDEHVVHHQNLSGACYVFLKRPERTKEAAQRLLETPGVESVFLRDEAASRFRLMTERIGDLFVLGDAHTVFGPLKADRQEVRLRSHGSAHEALVPLITSTPPKQACQNHLDVVRELLTELSASPECSV